MFIAQLFGLADTMCALLRVRCLGWKLFGLAWFLLGPVTFTVISTLKVRRLVTKDQTLKFHPSPQRSLVTMWQEIRELPGMMPKILQLFIYGMEIRFNGGWRKQGEEASFWGFLMGAYTDSFWAIFSWVLFKKLLAALNKHLLEGGHNAVVNIVLYTLDLCLFVWKWPFRDNMVNFSQMLAAVSNLMAIIVAALPMLLPENMIPEFIRGPVVMWITIAGTTVLTIAAAFDPLWSALGFVAVIGGRVTSCCNIGGAGGTLIANLRATLWVRFQMICLGRLKTKAADQVKEVHHQARAASTAVKRGKRARDGTPLTEDEWLIRVRGASYASKVRKKGLYNPEYKERYLVLHGGILKWYIISEMVLDEYDQYDWASSKVQGSWSCYGNKVAKIESGDDSYYAEKYGKGFGFEVTDEKGKTRRIMVTQEATRDDWVRKLQKLRKVQKNRPPRRALKSQDGNDSDDLDLPVPSRPFSVHVESSHMIFDKAFPLAAPSSLNYFGERTRQRKALVVTPSIQSDLGFAPAAIVRGRPADSVIYGHRPFSGSPSQPPCPAGVSVTASAKPPTVFITPRKGKLLDTHVLIAFLRFYN